MFTRPQRNTAYLPGIPARLGEDLLGTLLPARTSHQYGHDRYITEVRGGSPLQPYDNLLLQPSGVGFT